MIEQKQQLLKEIEDAIKEIVSGVECEDEFYKHILDNMIVQDKGDVLSVNACAYRIIVHTTTGYYVLNMDNDTEFTSCDVLNDMENEIAHVNGEQIVTKDGRVYRFERK